MEKNDIYYPHNLAHQLFFLGFVFGFFGIFGTEFPAVSSRKDRGG
jgi:hypothetical protein